MPNAEEMMFEMQKRQIVMQVEVKFDVVRLAFTR